MANQVGAALNAGEIPLDQARQFMRINVAAGRKTWSSLFLARCSLGWRLWYERAGTAPQ